MMFSMAGIPPLAGFFGKLLVFKAAVSSGHIILAVIGVIASVVAAFYYLKLIKIMFFDAPSVQETFKVRTKGLLRWVAIPCVIFVVTYIVFPDWLVYSASNAAMSLRP